MNHLAFAFGLLGNIVSFMVFLAPVPTFYRIYKKKTAEGYQSVPYVVGLFSAMLWIYYAFLMPDTTLLITINSVGCFGQTLYISFYLFYAPKKARLDTVKLVSLLNVCAFGLIVLVTQFLVKEPLTRAHIVGWICLIFSLCVFVAPLGVVRQVIRTKSVEYMPFLLSFFLTLSAVMWFFFGLLRKDYNIAIPNVLGFSFGVIQMVLYMVYKNAGKKQTATAAGMEQKQLPEMSSGEQLMVAFGAGKQLPAELREQIIDIVKLGTLMALSEKAPAAPLLMPPLPAAAAALHASV
ncbi:unnamed protein product [Cuscuta europaea]|uniref:Bidirectional sugar transporter SWEET n=2 Tax=Cuscuta europaea TaxID=41803 RepID=A0A9P0ZR44_CUSEU|nr:unnamed protein product [Cuscuta europaea]